MVHQYAASMHSPQASTRTLVSLLAAAVSSSASASAVAQAPAQIKVAEGFRATLVYDVPKNQGSWVSLTNADKGRLIACHQGGKLYRITLGKATGDKAKVEALDAPVGRAQGLLCAFDSLYVMGKGLAKGDKRSGLFRLTDTTGDDQFDKCEHLLQILVGGEHDGHAIVPSPDGKSIYICAGNRARLPKPDFTSSRMPRIFRGDLVLSRMPDARGHNTGALPMGGWIARISPDGEERELIANGFRNEYDIAFDPQGELFTYDSDMEWDIGAAWYRPTRVCHAVSGAEFGWRFGTGKWPEYFADSLSSVVDIGPGSPTGIVFGTGTKFPARYQRALFIADWSYGIIYAVHLTSRGASYAGTKEVFARAAPFPVTDMVVRPEDGALYFTVGGRGAKSALYRIEYVGGESMAPADAKATPAAGAKLRDLRHELEALHVAGAPKAVATAWQYLGHHDRHIRFAARIAIENQPVDEWQARVLAEKDPRTRIHGVIALARHGEPGLQEELLRRLLDVSWRELGSDEKLELLRAYGLVFSRMGETSGGSTRTAIIEALDAGFPDAHPDVNRELCRILCHLDAPTVVAKSLRLQADAVSQEEQMHYAYCLRTVTRGWTPARRKTYLQWFHKTASYRGGSSFRGFCNNIRKAAIDHIPASEKLALGDLVAKEPPKQQRVGITAAPRKFVKAWTVAELRKFVTAKTKGHDYARGRRLFGAASCVQCHRFAGEGGAIGPDLTALGGRFGVREILESTIEPSTVISDQYQPTIFELKDGLVIVGYVANYNHGTIKVAEDMFRPGDFTDIKVDSIKSRRLSPISMMPPGLLSTLTAEEVQDLVAYLRSGGNPEHALFK